MVEERGSVAGRAEVGRLLTQLGQKRKHGERYFCHPRERLAGRVRVACAEAEQDLARVEEGHRISTESQLLGPS